MTFSLSYNCWRENKNRYMFSFLFALVKLDIFEEVTCNFLLVGHTGNEVDQLFREAVHFIWSMVICHNKCSLQCLGVSHPQKLRETNIQTSQHSEQFSFSQERMKFWRQIFGLCLDKSFAFSSNCGLPGFLLELSA